MGQDIQNLNFTPEDFENYKIRLKEETALLKQWFIERKFAPATPNVGLELEGWLVNKDGSPSALAQEFLGKVDHKDVVPELSLFNFEINAPHHPLNANMMDFFKEALEKMWAKCEKTANEMGISTVMIGSLPSLRNSQLIMDNISPYNRFYALNQQVMRMRDHLPIEINITGEEKLKEEYDCILLESAATSLQIHLEVNQDDGADFYNASVLASPFMVALTANSAFLCEKSLWAESRIPVFEQTVIVGINETAQAKKRVTIGNGYLKESLFELFEENEAIYPPLIPNTTDCDAAQMSHVSFHNGTVWRWNRPIIGFNPDGTPNLRLEHRVIPAGPSMQDTLANIVIFLALVHIFKDSAKLMTKQISFESNYINLYEAARNGLESEFVWKNDQMKSLKDILKDDLYPIMKTKLSELGFTQEDIKTYLSEIMLGRLETGLNGSSWQKKFVEKNGKDYDQLVVNYKKHQNSGLPVHQWPI